MKIEREFANAVSGLAFLSVGTDRFFALGGVSTVSIHEPLVAKESDSTC